MKKELLIAFIFSCLVRPAFPQELPTFEKKILVSEPYSSCLALHDFNNDGKNDIVYWTQPSTLGILFSNNLGRKRTVIDSTITYSSPVDIADFNGDSKEDLLVGEKIFSGDGNGNFTGNIDFSGLRNGCMSFGDFNNDKNIDLVKLNLDTISRSIIDIFECNGMTWEKKNTIDLKEYGINFVYTADLNYDGNLDLIVAYESIIDPYATKISKDNSAFFLYEVDILFGNGDGTFQERKNILEYGFGIGWFGIYVNDYNKDSISDLVCFNSWSVVFLKNNGKGEFAKSVDLKMNNTSIWQWTRLPGDINGDKIADIFLVGTAEPYIGQYRIIYGLGNDSFSDEKNLNIDVTGLQIRTSTVGDLNADGFDDLLLSTEEGVFAFYNSNISDVEDQNLETRRDIIDLHPASPNPFNPYTTLSFSILNSGHVSLTVYDITGRILKTLINGTMTSGKHSINFDGSGFASGVYLYRLETGTTIKTGRMLLMK
jgi:hypothetical protein